MSENEFENYFIGNDDQSYDFYLQEATVNKNNIKN